MARVTTTRYVCDSCEKEVERPRDLHHFCLEYEGRAGRSWSGQTKAQLCEACTETFLTLVDEAYGFDLPDGMRVREPATKTPGQP